MKTHHKLDYLELPARDLEATKRFFNAAFAWTFEDFGPDYTAFSDQGLDGGFFRADQSSVTANGGALLVFFSTDLEATRAQVKSAGGVICKEIFPFPGGRRFQFTEPSGNEFAVWSDITPD